MDTITYEYNGSALGRDYELFHADEMTTMDEISVTLRQVSEFDNTHSFYENFKFYFYIKNTDGTKLFFDKVVDTVTAQEDKDLGPWGRQTLSIPVALNTNQRLFVQFLSLDAVGNVAPTSDQLFLDSILCSVTFTYRETPERTITANAGLQSVLTGAGSPFTFAPNAIPGDININSFPSWFSYGGLQVSDSGFNDAISNSRGLPIDIEVVENTFDTQALLVGVRYSPPAPDGHLESLIDLYTINIAGVRRDLARNVMVKESWDDDKYYYDHPYIAYLEPSEKLFLSIRRYGYDNDAANSTGTTSFTGGNFLWAPENGWAPSIHATLVEIPGEV